MTTVNSPAPPKLKLPKLAFVRLRRFSLFAANPDAEFAAGDGVLCLVGANGIGKSTLLSAINFCLTGTVPDPNRSFESIDEYYKYTRLYSRNYFRGRILGSDEDDAEITLAFTLGEFKYTVTRGLFEPDELRFLQITDLRGKHMHTASSPGDDVPRLHRHRIYADSLVAHAGFTSFEEFVFLQAGCIAARMQRGLSPRAVSANTHYRPSAARRLLVHPSRHVPGEEHHGGRRVTPRAAAQEPRLRGSTHRRRGGSARGGRDSAPLWKPLIEPAAGLDPTHTCLKKACSIARDRDDEDQNERRKQNRPRERNRQPHATRHTPLHG